MGGGVNLFLGGGSGWDFMYDIYVGVCGYVCLGGCLNGFFN